MTERNVLKFTRVLRIITFRSCKVLSCLYSASSMHLFSPSKIHPSIYFLVSHGPSNDSNFPSDIGSRIPYLATGGGGKTVYIPFISACYRCSICSSNFDCNMLIKSSTSYSSSFRNLLFAPFVHFLFLACVLFSSLKSFVLLSGALEALSPWNLCSVLILPLMVM